MQLRGSALALGVLKLFGWTLVWEGLPARQGVLIAYPHTSNWDFVVGVFAKWAIGIPAKFWGKDSLFKLPLFSTWILPSGRRLYSAVAPTRVFSNGCWNRATSYHRPR